MFYKPETVITVLPNSLAEAHDLHCHQSWRIAFKQFHFSDESEMFCSNHHKQVTQQLYLLVNGIAEQRCLRQPEVTIKIPHGVYVTSGGML